MPQYNDGESRTVNGVTYVRQGGQWHAQSAPGPVYGSAKVKDPLDAQKDQLAIAKAQTDLGQVPLETEAKRQNIAQGQVSMADTAFDNKSKLRNDFVAQPEVKAYTTALGELDKMFRAPDNAQGDLAVIYAFAKAMDPGSVVREGEMDMATATASLPQQLQAWVGQVNQGKRIPPNVRRGLVESARQAVYGYNQAYSQKYRFYADLAKRNNFDPAEILGPHAGDAFRADEKGYLAGQQQPKQPIDPNGQGDIGFAGAQPAPPGMTPQQEAAYNAFFAANPNATPEQLSQFTAAMGITLHNAEDIIKARQEGAGVRPAADAVVRPPDISDVRGQGGLDETADAAIRGIVDVPTMGLSDEIAAAGDTLFNGGTMQENLARQRAIDSYDTENNFPARLGGQLAGGFALPMFGARSVPQLAKVGAGYGAGYGFGSGEGNIGDRGLNALIGGVAGGATAGAIGGAGAGLRGLVTAGGRRLAGRTSPEQNALLRAADEEQVPINMADVYPETRNTVATLESIPGASGPVRTAVEAGRDAMEGRVQRLAGDGTPLEPAAGGETVRRAGERFIGSSGAKFRQRYDRLEKAAGDIKVPATQATQRVDEIISRLSETGETNKGEIAFLQGLKKDLSRDLSVGALRRFRTTLRKKISKGELTFGEDEANVLSVMDAAAEDISNGLAAQGKGNLASEFAKVDRDYRDRMQFISGTVQKLIGKRGQNLTSEQVFNNLKNMASMRGDSAGLGRLLREMEPGERSDITATFAEALGKNNKGEFSLAHLATQIEKLPKAMRTTIFGEEGARSLGNLLTLAKAKEATVGRLNNSRSGQVTNYRNVISTVLFGLPGGGAALGLAQAGNIGAGATGLASGAAIGGAGLGISRILSKALMNEDFTRAIAQAPATMNPKAIDAHMGRLRKIAARDPNVRSVVAALEEKLVKFANDNMSRSGQVAASPNERPEDDKKR